MSDGPYRSLNMEKVWRDLAQCVHYPANSVLDRTDALTKALLRTVKTQITPNGLRLIVEAFTGASQPDMFNTVSPEKLEAIRSLCLPSDLLNSAIDNAKLAVSFGLVGDDALENCLNRTIEDHCRSRSRQIEEHYLRKAELNETTFEKSRAIRRDLDGLVTQSFRASMTAKLIEWGKSGHLSKASIDKNSLDAGPVRATDHE